MTGVFNIDDAKKEVNELFQSLAPMVEEIVNNYSAAIDSIIMSLTDAKSLTNSDIREYMLKLSVECYLFSLAKDASLLKEDCATTLMKEAQAISYNKSEGTQLIRNNQSMIDTIDKQVVNMLYSAVADLMRTKLDEGHRMINTLNSILISRNAEAKLATNTEDGRQLLNE